MFRGVTKVTLDAKGRLAIPTRYREKLISRCDGQTVVTVDRDYCLLIYPYPDWEEIGRILISKELREFAGIERHAILIGQGKKFELWDDQAWSQKRDSWLNMDDENDLSGELDTISL